MTPPSRGGGTYAGHHPSHQQVTAAATVERRFTFPNNVPLLILNVMMAISLAVAINKGNLDDIPLPLAIMVGSLLLPLIDRLTPVTITTTLQTLVTVLLFAAPFLGSNMGFYDRWEPWDAIVHFYSGFVIGAIAIRVLDTVDARYGLGMPLWLTCWIVITIGGCAASVWEVIEFGSDTLLGSRMQRGSLTDTMADIICALSSTAVMALGLWARRRLMYRRVDAGVTTRSS